MEREEKIVYMLRTDYHDYPKSGWLIKIGYTKNLKNRMSNIQSGCPFRVYVHASAKSYSAKDYEKSFHEKLSEFNTFGEWFLVSDDDFDWVVDSLVLIQKEFRRENALV